MAALPIKIIVIVVVIVLVLSAVAAFFLLQTGQGISKTDAERIFSGQCQQYAQQSCSWDVTRNPDFAQFMSACKLLYGSEREAFSCIYLLCQPCKEIQQANQVKCAGICHACQGNKDAGISIENCCSEFSSQCTGVVECSVCTAA